ncbi:MAG: LysR family transcriptional regulator [Eubacteriales bacterium]
MNILYLKYAVEVARTGSISKAADALYVAQPNVSRAVKELEASLGITIFDRTSKGMTLTPDGERLMQYARNILSQIDEVEEIFKNGESRKKKFSISVPRASYIAHAFAQFSNKLPKNVPIEIFYKETNALRAINNILNADFNLGIIRFAERHDRYFREMLEEKGLCGELVTEFNYVLLMNKNHPLAEKEEVRYADLSPYIEIAHADPFVPSLPLSEVRKEELPNDTDRRIFVFERASQFDVLSANTEAFMWVSSVPDELLCRFGLVQRKCADNEKKYKDILIHRKDYHLTDLDKTFITELCASKRKYI